MPRRDRPDRDVDYDRIYPAQPPPAKPQSKIACGCQCGSCTSGAHCHNMGTGCNVR